MREERPQNQSVSGNYAVPSVSWGGFKNPLQIVDYQKHGRAPNCLGARPTNKVRQHVLEAAWILLYQLDTIAQEIACCCMIAQGFPEHAQDVQRAVMFEHHRRPKVGPPVDDPFCKA